MATPKLQTTREQRASEIPASCILPKLPDGRNVIISKRGFYVASAEDCSCRDHVCAKQVCKHMIRLGGFNGNN